MTRKSDHVDIYHGTAVPDPYRWLEDDTSAETAAWVEAQNASRSRISSASRSAPTLQARVLQLNDYEKYSAPSRKGPYFFFSRNSGLQNQSVLFIQQGLDGAPEVLIDPNTWSADGTVSLSVFAPSKDATHAVYGISRSGSDWQQSTRSCDLATKTNPRRHARVGQGVGRRVARRRLLLQPVSCAADRAGEGVDQREPPGLLPSARHAAVAGSSSSTRIRRTRSGFIPLQTTEDERFAILTISERGKGKDGNALHVCDLSKQESDASRRSSQRSQTTRSASSTTSATSCSCRPTAARRTGESC